jgi:hypothetical protein
MSDQASAGGPARRTRRQLLAGGTGVLAGVLAAEALARPAPAAAANGDSVILGQSNSETQQTTIANSADGLSALLAIASGGGDGLAGKSSSGDGVVGSTSGADGSGVFGFNGGDGNGVSGVVNNAGASGVYGQNGDTGFGVAGRANGGVGTLGDSANGVGVWASSANGTALQVTGLSQFTGTAQFFGTALFSNSGVLTIGAGKSSATQGGVTLTPASLVLATVQQDRAGVWVRSAVPNVAKHSVTVHLSKPVPARTRVAWFVVN